MGCGDAISLYTVMHSQRNCLIVNQKINICNFINLTIKCTQRIQHSIPTLDVDDGPQNVPSYLSPDVHLDDGPHNVPSYLSPGSK